MEKSEKAKQLRALRKYGKKVRRKMWVHGMRPSVYQAGVTGSGLLLCPVCALSCVYYLTVGSMCSYPRAQSSLDTRVSPGVAW